MKTTGQKIIIAIVFFSLMSMPFSSIAYTYTVEKHPEAPVENRFVVGPAKIELTVGVGETRETIISVENRMGKKQTFVISFEDFIGSRNSDETVVLLGNAKSETSLRDSLYVEKKEISLEQGERALIPVTVSISGKENAGGKFGAVVVSATKNNNGIEANDRAYTGATIIGRIAALFFVTVPGEFKSEGMLTGFTTKENKIIFGSSEIPVRLTFENTGDANLNPYGGIIVKNMFGGEVQKEVLNPWFALPNSIRTRDVVIVSSGLFGKYTAIAQVNRGYGNIVDEKSITFYVITPSVVFFFILAIALIVSVKKLVVRFKKNA
jgi:hypothetical protein